MTCRHCGVRIYEGVPTFIMPPGPMARASVLRRNYWHNATAEELQAACKERKVPMVHVAAP